MSREHNLALDLGTLVRITDADLRLRGAKGIVSGITLHLDDPSQDTIEIINHKTKFEDIFGRIVASTAQLEKSMYLYDRVVGAFTPELSIKESVLQKTFNAADFIMSIGQESGVSWDKDGLLVENITPYESGVKGRVLLRGGGILLSDSVDSFGRRVYSTAITAQGINASLLNVGRINTENINIYSGNQVRFMWKSDGIFAYASDIIGQTIYDQFVRYNEDGLLFQKDGKRILSLDWSGLYIGAADGSLELTGDLGFVLYNSDDIATRLPLIHLGRISQTERGMVFYDVSTGTAQPSLVSTSTGQLWLRRMLAVGESGGETGITGEIEYIPGTNDPLRIWAGSTGNAGASPFRVHASGALYATKGTIGGFTIGAKTLTYGSVGADNYFGLGEDDDYRLWAGHSNPYIAPLSITKKGHLYATSGEIAGAFRVGGNLSSQYFASGALGHGWRISGDGTAEFKDVYVRGTLSSTVFEYKRISSVGGSLYIAPTLIFPTPSQTIAKIDGRYVITFPGDHRGNLGGREWDVGDGVSISGYLEATDGNTYEVADWRSVIIENSATKLMVRVMLPASGVVVYNDDKEQIFSEGLSVEGGILLTKATCVYLGTTVGNVLRRKGILLESGAQYAPYIDIYDDIDELSMPKVRLGNLQGITDPLFGGDLSGYGLYSENVYLRGTIFAQAGRVGGWNVDNGALYTGGRNQLVPDIPADKSKMYLGDEGIGLGTAFTYNAEEDSLFITARSISIGGGGRPVQTVEEYVDEQVGYRVEVLTTSNVLSSEIPETTIYARVYKGPNDITAELDPSLFRWTRVSDDSFSDDIWNNNPAHQGRKVFTLTTLDIYYSATFTCSIENPGGNP